ncbi:MAG: hypothetical protein WBQ46_09115 [Terriglobales bacterium]
MSSDKRYDRGFRSLTSEYVRDRLERLDEMLADPANERRFDYLQEQREWWEGQLPFCYKREGLLAR